MRRTSDARLYPATDYDNGREMLMGRIIRRGSNDVEIRYDHLANSGSNKYVLEPCSTSKNSNDLVKGNKKLYQDAFELMIRGFPTMEETQPTQLIIRDEILRKLTPKDWIILISITDAEWRFLIEYGIDTKQIYKMDKHAIVVDVVESVLHQIIAIHENV